MKTMRESPPRALLLLLAISLTGFGCGLAVGQTPSTAVPPTTTPIAQTAPPAAAAPSSPAASAPRVVLIDSDMASDDWMAMLYLFHRADVVVQAITVAGTGEAHCQPGVANATGLVALARYPSLPVACGRPTPLQGNHAFPNAWRQGVDTRFGLSLPAGNNAVPAASQAVDVLTSEIRASPEKVNLLILGPMTNLAEALQKTPSLRDNIQMIYVMGGAVDVPGNIAITGVGIDNQVAEWNMYIDPHAANAVFHSGAPITLVPLDATNYVPVTPAFYEKLKARHTTPEASLIFDLYTSNDWFYKSGTVYFWDQLTAAILSDEKLAQFEHHNLCVVEDEGPTSGQTKTASNCPDVRVALSADQQSFENLFLDMLNAPAP